VAGARGFNFDPRGQREHRYSWGLGHKTNNQAEVLVALKGLTLIPKDKSQSIIVIGDSEPVIKSLRGISKQINPNLQGIYKKINLNKANFEVWNIFTSCDTIARKQISWPRQPNQ
jgi:ribonuclease HI